MGGAAGHVSAAGTGDWQVPCATDAIARIDTCLYIVLMPLRPSTFRAPAAVRRAFRCVPVALGTRWLVAFAVVLALQSCAADLSARREAIVRRVFSEALERGDYRVFAEAYDSAFVKHVGRRRFTLAEERVQAAATHELSSTLSMHIDALMSRGDLVSVVYTARGTVDRPIGDTAPTGRTFEVRGATLYRFRGLKIVEEWTIYDQLDLQEQLGLGASAASTRRAEPLPSRSPDGPA